MKYPTLAEFVAQGARELTAGPIAILLMEDQAEINSTIRHHLSLGFRRVIVVGHPSIEVSPDLAGQISRISHDVSKPGSTEDVVNAISATCVGQWVYYGYNAEYLFFPFCEDRSIGELTRFVAEERRDSVLTYVIDLYAKDLKNHRNGVAPKSAHLDKSGYYALSRSRDGEVMERQLSMFGGLRWRFEEHVAHDRRNIDRIGLFRAQSGLKLRADHTFNLEEMNTYANPWHHSVTAAICSFRAAKSLKTNPGPSESIETFAWHNSTKFNWHSRQLLDLGLMEPGQWF